MLPRGVVMRVQLVYSNCSPGLSSGCWPTTPRPRTSSTSPLPWVMTQWRPITCAGTSPVLRMVIV